MATSPPYPTHPRGSADGYAFRPTRWWQRKSVRYGALTALLAVSGLVILALVREQTGTEGFLVGLGLALLPLPLLMSAFRWLDRVEPGPWRNLVFAFAWGACAAALIAIVANSFATRWIATATADPSHADTLGATVIAPVVEETAKAAAVLLVFLFRRRDFTSLVDGVVIAGFTATGFAFTENILYLGTAFGTDQLSGGTGLASVTAATFFVRVIMSPFAHPLFTVLTGIGFGVAAVSADWQRGRRVLVPLSGLLLAMAMHSVWNGSATFGEYGFFAVYAGFMVPAFGLLTWWAIWARQRELRAVREALPAYAAAGWLTPPEPYVLGSMRARRVAREYAAHHFGKAGARSVAEYETYATRLAFLRHRGLRGRAGSDFALRERELLFELWRRREVARPAMAYAGRDAEPRYGYGYGYGYEYGAYAGYGGHGGYGPHPQPVAYGVAAYPGYNPYRS
ncbi:MULTISPECIES: PrsW family intramembrane metalloprotease [Streptomyces]|uniref:Putative integral membrane protein n=1 Tax=Streptomyces scabiei (strain 87.22) TaxID=680198 RepID=C9ZFH1_STRSW|nr:MULTISPECIES: PrsW family intramembrane metalloprotease [Streptomyces]MBP5862834.1 PrsW family intramembrane metalloprotease [Streptomyces sp. LBUM 1484]MBP5906712.1 PrsW family intramembrane metalloprotease [Streptomyces sp. LBUM 1478]MBP5930565.1 PrsW family intramembrane metalloprotease [Streptomyces sp. LBUM 1479]KFG07511.1 membrane protein [Streptomyces scabiei]MBP5876701.1 PrsW family intramembrane metalloprotease [Streptomyces sp. LBUM 1477]